MVLLVISLTILIKGIPPPGWALSTNGIVDAPYSSRGITLDGAWTTPNEWSDANVTLVNNTDGYIAYVGVKHDNSDLYILVDYVSAQITIGGCVFAFDCLDQGGVSPSVNDFSGQVTLKASPRDSWFTLSQGNGNGWHWVQQATGYQNYSYYYQGIGLFAATSSQNDPYEPGRDHTIYEIEVPISFLHLQSVYGFYVAAYSGYYYSTTPGEFLEWPERLWWIIRVLPTGRLWIPNTKSL